MDFEPETVTRSCARVILNGVLAIACLMFGVPLALMDHWRFSRLH
jgi:hypothetical protein